MQGSPLGECPFWAGRLSPDTGEMQHCKDVMPLFLIAEAASRKLEMKKAWKTMRTSGSDLGNSWLLREVTLDQQRQDSGRGTEDIRKTASLEPRAIECRSGTMEAMIYSERKGTIELTLIK